MKYYKIEETKVGNKVHVKSLKKDGIVKKIERGIFPIYHIEIKEENKTIKTLNNNLIHYGKVTEIK